MGVKPKLIIAGTVSFTCFILISAFTGYEPGVMTANNFYDFIIQILKIFPGVFILIGLFDVWIKKETVEKYLGRESGLKGLVLAVLLSGTTIGGLYVAFPVAYTLQKKGARLSVIFTFISASGICRVPMTLFEASFMGWKFSLIRILVALPLVIISSVLLGKFLEKRHYKLTS